MPRDSYYSRVKMRDFLLKLFKKGPLSKPTFSNLPTHIAIIMDGNGRWARMRALPRIAGHRKGVDSLRTTVRTCGEIGVKYLTVFAFSTENWERPKDEIDYLMSLFSYYIDSEIDELMEKKVKLCFLGKVNDLSPGLQKKIAWAMEKTASNTGLNLCVMVSYSGRIEIVNTIREIVAEGKRGEEIDEALVDKHLYTKEMPDPDLLIRTAGEMRISNFLLWQIAYSEIYVTSVLWPDFRAEELFKAIREYGKRTRKFGRV